MNFFSKTKRKGWWRESFVTLMVIPEKTRRVHRLVIPFFLLKAGVVTLSLSLIFLMLIGFDYLNVLGQLGENKALKGENFKLRQEIQTIRNKVETMEATVERVRNYAKKLQILTGQGEKGDMPTGGTDLEAPSHRAPSGKPDRHSSLNDSNTYLVSDAAMPSREVSFGTGDEAFAANLDRRIESLDHVSYSTEDGLSRLHAALLAKSAIINATPSLVPIAGWISSAFGYRRNPYDGSFRLHAGIDIAAEPGTPVRAPADAFVVYSGYREGYGKAVVLNHGYGISTLYAHNSKLFVNAGTRVKRGEVISQVGNTGHSTGPHLHYEIRKNGIPVNPASFFSRIRF